MSESLIERLTSSLIRLERPRGVAEEEAREAVKEKTEGESAGLGPKGRPIEVAPEVKKRLKGKVS